MTGDVTGPGLLGTAGVPEPALERAAFALVAGEVVGIPTDTVYGLAVDPARPGATRVLFSLKGRPSSLELPVLVADVSQAEQLVAGKLSPAVRMVVHNFWPGPLTLVLGRRPGLGWELGGDDSTIGVRCPAHPVARWLCERVGPLAATSANRHGEPPLTTADAVRSTFGEQLALVVDGGPLTGAPSTVVKISGAKLRCLREGSLPFAEVEALLASDSPDRGQ